MDYFRECFLAGTVVRRSPGMGDNPSPFIVREIPWNPYEYCGRMIVRDVYLVIFIGGTGRFEVLVSEVQYVLMGLGPIEVKSLYGPAGKMSLSETGKEKWCESPRHSSLF